MCLQKISISSENDFLNFLNSCEKDRLYPPLRFYENENFMYIKGADKKQASISKSNFQVEIDGILYTNEEDARRQLLFDINKIHNSFDSGVVNTVYVSDLSHLPAKSGMDINLIDLNTYFFTTKVDLEGGRLVAGNKCVITGFSSENCGVYSTGLPSSVAILKITSTTVVKYMEFRAVGTQTALDIDCIGNRGGNAAFDWTGVNFEDFAFAGVVKNIDDFIFTIGVIRNCSELNFDLYFDSVVIESSLLQSASSGNLINFLPTAICNRRIRIEKSPLITIGSANGINASPSMQIDNEAYLLEKVNFSNSGSGSSLVGLDSSSEKSLFTDCKGIRNTSAGASMFGKQNTTPTQIQNQNQWVKIEIPTTLTSDSEKFSHANNKLTCNAAIERKYLILGNLSFFTANNRICEIGVNYTNELSVSGIIPMSITSQEADGNGRAQSVPFQATLVMKQTEYIEIWIQMNNGTNNITVEDMTVSIVELK